MKQDKKNCFCITPGRIAGGVVIAAILVNLSIAGAVSAVTSPLSTITMTQTLPTPAMTWTLTLPPGPTEAPVLPATVMLTDTSTPSPSATPTFTPLPSVTPCVSQAHWPIYIVQPGDTVFSLAPRTDSTVSELMLANCLSSHMIYVGQLLYVPHLPITPVTLTPSITPTSTIATATFTPSITPTNTTQPETPTEFQNPSLSCDPPSYAAFSVLPYDPEGIDSVSAIVVVYDPQIQGTFGTEILMDPKDSTYYGSLGLASPYTVHGIVAYFFSATDGLGNKATSQAYYVDLSSSCAPPQPAGG